MPPAYGHPRPMRPGWTPTGANTSTNVTRGVTVYYGDGGWHVHGKVFPTEAGAQTYADTHGASDE